MSFFANISKSRSGRLNITGSVPFLRASSFRAMKVSYASLLYSMKINRTFRGVPGMFQEVLRVPETFQRYSRGFQEHPIGFYGRFMDVPASFSGFRSISCVLKGELVAF